MYFDGETYVNLGDQSDSCFGNFALCPDGWTLGLWLKVDDLSLEQVVIDSGGVGDATVGFGIYLPGTGAVELTMAALGTRCRQRPLRLLTAGTRKATRIKCQFCKN